jgi:hypothetical protein
MGKGSSSPSETVHPLHMSSPASSSSILGILATHILNRRAELGRDEGKTLSEGILEQFIL